MSRKSLYDLYGSLVVREERNIAIPQDVKTYYATVSIYQLKSCYP